MKKQVDEVYNELQSELSKQHDEIKEYLDKIQTSVPLITTKSFREEVLKKFFHHKD